MFENKKHILPKAFQKGTESNQKINTVLSGLGLFAGIILGVIQAFKGLEEMDDFGSKMLKK